MEEVCRLGGLGRINANDVIDEIRRRHSGGPPLRRRLSAPVERYRKLLRAAVRYFTVDDSDELGARTPDALDVWPELWRRHRSPVLVAAAVIDARDKGTLSAPGNLEARLRKLLTASQRRYAFLSDEWAAIRRLGVPVVPLKGMWLTEAIYPKTNGAATRLFNDVDFQTSREYGEDVRRALEERGYRRISVYPNGAGASYAKDTGTSLWAGLPTLEYPLDLPEQTLERGRRLVFIEAHHTLRYHDYGLTTAAFEVRDESDAAGHFIHCCLHMAKGFFDHGYGFVDVALMMRSDSFDARATVERAREVGAERTCAVAIGVVEAAFGPDVIPDALEPLRRLSARRMGYRLAGEAATMDRVRILWRGVRIAVRIGSARKAVTRGVARHLRNRVPYYARSRSLYRSFRRWARKRRNGAAAP